MTNGRLGLRLRLAWLVLPLLLAAATATAVEAHKFYMSLTVVDHNATERSLEVTLRLFADDLELAIARRGGEALKHGQPGFDAAVLAYVRDGLQIRRADGTPISLSWVGLENKVDVTWVYVEATGVAATSGLTVRNTVFMELFTDQVNLLHAQDARGRRALDFRGGDGFKPF